MKLKLANFNVRNLAMPGTKVYGRTVASDEYDKKTGWMGERLKLMGADIVGFQEVFEHEALVRAVELSGEYRKPFLYTADCGGEIPRTAILSRFPLSDTRTITAFPAEAILSFGSNAPFPIRNFHHPVVRTKVELPIGIKVSVYIVHMKSKRPFFDGMQVSTPASEADYATGKARALVIRAAEALALRHLILSDIRDNSIPMLLFGDLNDYLTSVTTSIISGDSPLETFPDDAKKAIWDQLLYSTYEYQLRQSSRDVYFTHIYNGSYEVLDHIFVSQEFIRSNPNCIGNVEYMRLFNDHVIDRTLTKEDIPEWQSDHGQVLVSLSLKDNPR
ncbi:MAG: endonuclease/exonuclease/phosphatase family protein [Brevinematales bacterium]|nr:endonuclease/exonuclease/phosphatase family protein [Brevinematales bacterium]